jgi:hypothetical protein
VDREDAAQDPRDRDPEVDPPVDQREGPWTVDRVDQVPDGSTGGRAVDVDSDPGEQRRHRDQPERPGDRQQAHRGRRREQAADHRRPAPDAVGQPAAEGLGNESADAEAGDDGAGARQGQRAPTHQVERQEGLDELAQAVDDRAREDDPERPGQTGDRHPPRPGWRELRNLLGPSDLLGHDGHARPGHRQLAKAFPSHTGGDWAAATDDGGPDDDVQAAEGATADLSTRTPDGDYAPFTLPGYGLAPVTRDYDGGPEPAAYGIPPELPPVKRTRRAKRPKQR